MCFLFCFPSKLEGVERRAVREHICEESGQTTIFPGSGCDVRTEIAACPLWCCPLVAGANRAGFQGLKQECGPRRRDCKKDIMRCDTIILYLAGTLKNGYVYIVKWAKQMLNG